MLQGEKILLTGPAGQIALPLGERLAQDNEVWGIARFSGSGDREKVEAAGHHHPRGSTSPTATSATCPDDFTVRAAPRRVPGRRPRLGLGAHGERRGHGAAAAPLPRARAAMVMSTTSVYKPHADPWHPYLETDPFGDANVPYCPTYPISKIAGEAVARYCARAYDLPVVIARMNASYGPNGGLPAYHLDMMVEGDTVRVRHDPCPYSAIHDDDIYDQLEPLLDARVGAGHGRQLGRRRAGAAPRVVRLLLRSSRACPPTCRCTRSRAARSASIVDNAKRLAITGPCKVPWRDGMRRMVEERYPDGFSPGQALTNQTAQLTATATVTEA